MGEENDKQEIAEEIPGEESLSEGDDGEDQFGDFSTAEVGALLVTSPQPLCSGGPPKGEEKVLSLVGLHPFRSEC